jgi:DNA polymerase III alpha subunit (gram-positive type)
VGENVYSDFSSSGLTYVGGVLKHKGHRVASTTAADGLRNFIKFLTQFPNVILIGHNIQNFDIPFLLHQLRRHNLLKDFENAVQGCIDTLKLARNVIP